MYNISTSVSAKNTGDVMVLIQEIKRNIIYSRFRKETDGLGITTFDRPRLLVHLTITVQKICNLRKYQGQTHNFFDIMQKTSGTCWNNMTMWHKVVTQPSSQPPPPRNICLAFNASWINPGLLNTKITCCSTEMRKLEEIYWCVNEQMADTHILCNKAIIYKYTYISCAVI
jgi:hypothetical protein